MMFLMTPFDENFAGSCAAMLGSTFAFAALDALPADGALEELPPEGALEELPVEGVREELQAARDTARPATAMDAAKICRRLRRRRVPGAEGAALTCELLTGCSSNAIMGVGETCTDRSGSGPS